VLKHLSPQPDERGGPTPTIVLENWQPPAWLHESGDDPARAIVMAMLRALADSGHALWTTLESGDVRLSCASGVVYHLTESGVTRIR
jgi:hypothetical protein